MKTKILLIALSLMILLTSNCFAEKLFDENFTRQVAIDKLFVGRTLDGVEGIWYLDKKVEFAIVQKSLIQLKNKDKERYAGCDYIVIHINKRQVWAGLKRTDILHAYNGIGGPCIADCQWRQLSPTTLQIGGPIPSITLSTLFDSGLKNDFLMRIYPIPSF